jgi:hypothetical protein
MPLTVSELKLHLWNCAEILCGSAVDRRDWKGYILPLLFFKRIFGTRRLLTRPMSSATLTRPISQRFTASSFPTALGIHSRGELARRLRGVKSQR